MESKMILVAKEEVSVIQKFIRAFNSGNPLRLGRLIDPDCIAVSSAGAEVVGREEVLKTYRGLIERFGKAAKYVLGNLDGQAVIVIYHQRGSTWIKDSVKRIEVQGMRAVSLRSTRDPNVLTKVVEV